MFKILGTLVDIHTRSMYGAELSISEGKIASIKACDHPEAQYIMPGFIDAHIHIESSMLVPYEFARMALQHGTVATISDPHEIANVCGIEGVKYMLENAKGAGLKFHFGAPSCVPATGFETAGAVIDADGVKSLLAIPEIFYLSEMMNYPGVLHKDPQVMQKIDIAKRLNKPVDGHTPGLRAEHARQYIEAGISTDHECFTIEEAMDKIKFGMKIIIREGSAARNFDALHPLIGQYPDMLMFCSDDKHPDDLIEGHINLLVKRALDLGYDFFDVLRIACLNPVLHYKMKSGTLKEGDPADFIIVDHPGTLNVLGSYIDGQLMTSKDGCILPKKKHPEINQFNIQKITPDQLMTSGDGKNVPVIDAIDGSLITEKYFTDLPSDNGIVYPDTERDILKIAVVNRYNDAPISTGFIRNFNLKNCAIASTVAHDSHNIIAVGSDDLNICTAINALIDEKGGLAVVSGAEPSVLPLPVGGLMSTEDCVSVGKAYLELDQMVRVQGCKLRAPFMTLSFMALLVIPKIKISDKGMFDAESFSFYQ
jgi:adenine deaminase